MGIILTLWTGLGMLYYFECYMDGQWEKELWLQRAFVHFLLGPVIFTVFIIRLIYLMLGYIETPRVNSYTSPKPPPPDND